MRILGRIKGLIIYTKTVEPIEIRVLLFMAMGMATLAVMITLARFWRWLT